MKIIEAENLKKNYNGFTAVDGVNFHLNRGEIFGFLGPNGAGKTTTINMLTGMAKITEGKVKLSPNFFQLFSLPHAFFMWTVYSP